MMTVIAKIANDWKPLIMFAKGFIIDAWQGSKYARFMLSNSRDS